MASLRAAVGRFACLMFLIACLVGLPGRGVAAEDTAADATTAIPRGASLAELEAYGDAVAADLDAFWAARLDAAGVAYHAPTVRFYTETITPPCGLTLEPGVTAPGYYCALDEHIYLDGVDNVTVAESFGPGWLATVIAHEWGHHVQKLLGLPIAQLNKPEGVSVRLELQADCFAGGWTGDADDRGLIDDDAIDVSIFILAYLGSPPQQAVALNQGHGSSEQRVRTFLLGYDEGVEVCLA